MFDLRYVTTILIGIIIILLTYIIWFFHDVFQYWKRKGVPYLKPTIIPFGNTLDLYLGKVTLGELFSNAYLEFKKRGEKHGGVYFSKSPIYLPIDPEIIKKILISDAHIFPNHGLYINPEEDIVSGHMFNMENAEWKDLRIKMPSIFTSSKMKKNFEYMQKIMDPLKNWLDEYAKSGEPLEIKNVITRFTTDNFATCAWGIDTNTLKKENDELMYHGRQFFNHQWGLYRNSFVFTVPRNLLKKIRFRTTTKQTEKYVLDFFSNLFKYRKQNNVFRNDLTDTLMKLTEAQQEKDFSGRRILKPLSIDEFSAQMYMFFAAGYETSSSTTTFALYELAKNPECQIKLRNQINTILAKNDYKLTYDSLMDMKYLENVVNETLRIYPIFPILPRACTEDYPIPGTDVVLEKGSFVIVSNMGIQRDPEYYPEPLKFDPERWTYENSLGRPFVANLPFGEGPRICVGKRFGLLQTKLAILTVIKNYEITLNEKTTKGMKFVNTELILRKTGDVWLNLKKVTV